MLRPVQNLQTGGRVCMAAPVHTWRLTAHRQKEWCTLRDAEAGAGPAQAGGHARLCLCMKKCYAILMSMSVLASQHQNQGLHLCMLSRPEQDLQTARSACTLPVHTGHGCRHGAPSREMSEALQPHGLIVLEATGGCPQTAHSGARACPTQSAVGIRYRVRFWTEWNAMQH